MSHLVIWSGDWSTLVKTHDCRLGQRIEVELEADDRRRRVRCHRQAGVTDKFWEMSDMVKVLENWEQSGS